MTYPLNNLSSIPNKAYQDLINDINNINNIFKLVECFLYSNTKNIKKPITLLNSNAEEYDNYLLMSNFYAFLNHKLIDDIFLFHFYSIYY